MNGSRKWANYIMGWKFLTLRNLSGEETEFTVGFLGHQFVLPESVVFLVALVQFQGKFSFFLFFQSAQSAGVGQQLGQRQDGDGVRAPVRLTERLLGRLGVEEPAKSDDLDDQIKILFQIGVSQFLKNKIKIK